LVPEEEWIRTISLSVRLHAKRIRLEQIGLIENGSVSKSHGFEWRRYQYLHTFCRKSHPALPAFGAWALSDQTATCFIFFGENPAIGLRPDLQAACYAGIAAQHLGQHRFHLFKVKGISFVTKPRPQRNI
jgi:hypothetical protein